MQDVAEILSSNDPVLKKVIDQIELPKPIIPNSVFHDLMACIIEQQIPYRSTKKTFEKLLIRANISELTLGNFSLFEREALNSLSLSSTKVQTISRVLENWGDMPHNWSELSVDEIRSTLKRIKGVGPWTIDMLLLYTLQRPDVFPADDYHLKQLMPQLYGLNTKSSLKAQMTAASEKWSPWKSMAVIYLLEWKKVQKKR